MNVFNAVGRLTRDVEINKIKSGDSVGNFTLAVNRNFTNQQGEREADFINCVIWRKAADTLAQYTQKGSQIGITGRIQTRNYENDQGGRVYVTEVVVENFYFLESKSKSNNQQGYQQQNYQPNNNANMQGQGQFVNVNEDDLPF